MRSKLTARGLLGLVCLLTLLLASCGKGAGYSGFATGVPTPQTNAPSLAPDSQQIFRNPILGSSLDIATFDPALVTDVYSSQAVSMVFNGLMRLDNNLQVQPELAQSWSQSSDGLQWTFHLRPGLAFSDGTPLTSQDVAYSIDRALQPATKSQNALYYLALIKDSDKLNAGKIKTIIGDSILTPDANTVIIVTNKKAEYFLDTLTYPTSFVVEKKLIAKYGAKFTDHLNENEGGSGPFKVSQYVHGKEIDFVPNPYYYGLKPQLQKVVIPFVASDSIAYQEYLNGQLDETSVPIDRLSEAKQFGSQFIEVPQLSTDYLATNFLAKPFDNLYIRQAFALSIQRETINNVIYDGIYIPTYHIIPQGMIGYNPNLTGPAGVKDSRGNISVARQRLQTGLQQEGWSNVSQMPPIKLTYQKDPTYDKLVALLAQMWQNALGVTVTPNPVDFTTLVNTLLPQAIGNPKGLQMWLIGWTADYPDPQDWTTLQFDKGSFDNNMNYGQNNSADATQEQFVQQQLERADAENDQATRLAEYDNAEQQLINEVAWIPLYQIQIPFLLKPYVQGVVPNPISITPPTDWANIYIGAH